MSLNDRRLGQILVDQGELDAAHFDFVLELQKSSGLPFGEILIANNLASEVAVYRALAGQAGLPFLEQVSAGDVCPAFVDPAQYAQSLAHLRVMQQHQTLPLRDHRLVLADPQNARKLMLRFGRREPVVAPPSVTLTAVEALFLQHYEAGQAQATDERALLASASEFVDAVVRKAVVARASDIHFEIEHPACYVRYRIDGDLRTQTSYDLRLHQHVVNVVLMRSLGNPSNNQKFDDAAFRYRLSDKVTINLRVSKVPTEGGPALVMRVLRSDNMLKRLDTIGFLPEQIQRMQQMVRKPYGMILLGGPTGAGKSTTLYALVNELRGQDTKIISIEDPIEVNVPLVEQVQVNVDAGVTFATAIRAFLRHDPDALLVGEIRDGETANMAVEAALTGHIVLSSIHANTAFDVLTRLLDLGVSSRNLSALVGVVNQRLVKKLCGCQDGCERCGGTGYHGRVAVAEILEIDSVMREFLYKEDFAGFMEAAKTRGFKNIQQVARQYVLNGITSQAEIAREIAIDEKT